VTRVDFHPEATDEASAAAAWYAEQSSRAADAFMRELDDAVLAVSESAEAWPQYLHATRRFLLRRFPFMLIYRVDADRALVVAVAHAHRRPGYWRSRT
jgi:plasmid stabilization system protein ParE